MTGVGLVDAFAAVWHEHFPAIRGLEIAVPLAFLLNPAIILYLRWRHKAEKIQKAMGKPAWIMSSLERVLYIWAVMFKEYHLIAGWLVLKAFSEWMAANEARAMRGVEKKQRIYDIYLEGNALSIIVGLLCGSLGKWVELSYARYWGFGLLVKTSCILWIWN
jgi:hypothetical protein